MQDARRNSRIIPTLVIAACASQVFASEPDLQGCSLRILADLDVGGTDQPTIKASLNGLEGQFVFDPMNLYSYLRESAAKRLGLYSQEVPGLHRGRSSADALQRAVHVKEIAIGNARFDRSMMLAPDSRNDDSILGVLGRDIFSAADYELDLAHGKVRLFSLEHCPGPPVYWTKQFATARVLVSAHQDPDMTFPLTSQLFLMNLDGKAIETRISPLITLTTIDSRVTHMVFGFDEKSPELENGPEIRGKPTARFRPMQISAEGLSLNNFAVRVVQSTPASCHIDTKKESGGTGYADCWGNPPLILGLDLLRKTRIYVESRTNQIYVSTAEATN